MSTLEYLQGKEWSMGNGQCPDCGGVPSSWYGHPLYLNPKNIGHKKGCKLALAISGADGVPLYQGEFKTADERESCLVPMGGMNILSTQIKGSNPEHRALYEQHNAHMRSRMDKIFLDAMGLL